MHAVEGAAIYQNKSNKFNSRINSNQLFRINNKNNNLIWRDHLPVFSCVILYILCSVNLNTFGRTLAYFILNFQIKFVFYCFTRGKIKQVQSLWRTVPSRRRRRRGGGKVSIYSPARGPAVGPGKLIVSKSLIPSFFLLPQLLHLTVRVDGHETTSSASLLLPRLWLLWNSFGSLGRGLNSFDFYRFAIKIKVPEKVNPEIGGQTLKT